MKFKIEKQNKNISRNCHKYINQLKFMEIFDILEKLLFVNFFPTKSIFLRKNINKMKKTFLKFKNYQGKSL